VSAATWLSSRLQVAEIAANLVSRLAAREPPPYATGTVEWHLDAGRQQVHAHNVGNQEIALAYALAHPTSTASALQPIPPHSSYNATEDLATFRQGRVTMAPTVPGACMTGLDRLIALTVGALTLGVPVRVVTDVDVAVVRDERTRLFKVRVASPTVPVEARVQATDTAGNTVHATARLGSTSQGASQHEVELPPGVDLEPVVRTLFVELLVPLSVYEQATAERRRVVMNGLPELLGTSAAT
jgi:hypothetical protein